MSSDSEKLYEQVQHSLLSGSLLKAVLSKPVRTSGEIPRRVDIRPVLIGTQTMFQFSYRVGNQELHRNLAPEEAAQEIRRSAGNVYRDCLVRTTDAEWTARFSKKGHCSLTQQRVAETTSATPSEHNKSRPYLIPDGQVVPFLVATGVMSKNGRVHARHYSKFRQINRYVEFIRDVVPRLPADGEIRVVDFGSGKSYLTFAVHYYLTSVLGRQVSIMGLDRRKDVISSCRAVAAELQLEGIEFSVGDIAGFAPGGDVHLAISLHACDTATDDALAVAVSWKAAVILAVPCCQHELAACLSKTQYPVISGHGILHERFAALATDAVRAELLECVGYNTSVIEFIDMEHTARNLLIRAIRRSAPRTESADRADWQRLQAFADDFGLPALRLQKKLAEYGCLDEESLRS